METWIRAWEALLRADGISTLAVLAAYVVFLALESIRPAEAAPSWPGRLRNLFYLFQFKILGMLAIAAWYAFGPSIEVIRAEWGFFRMLPFVFLNLFLTDFLYYWYHRAQHRFEPLWAVHELHHADGELNVTTSYRTYWLEAPIQLILIATPTYLIFGQRGAVFGIAVLALAQFFLLFTHANLRLGLGPFSGVVCGPQVHRIHHSTLPEHRDKNFAQIFPFIDRLFGTYYAPARGEFPPTGTEHLASDAPIREAMLRPFVIWLDELARLFGVRPEKS